MRAWNHGVIGFNVAVLLLNCLNERWLLASVNLLVIALIVLWLRLFVREAG
jgi:hypothetical protein